MSIRVHLFLLLSLVSLATWAQELPVTRVVLFTSGVGFFERSGTVTGNAVVPLTFTEDQVNDVLKSLILRDPDGSVGVVGYPSQDPLERSLGSFALDLGGPGGLASLLPQLRGVSLTLWTPDEVTGRLIGIDSRTDKDRTEPWLTLATSEGLRVLPLSSVTQVKLLDPRLDQELGQALTLLAGSRDSRKKTVTARFEGAGTRTVTLGYIAEAPVWKTSYRLDLSGGRLESGATEPGFGSARELYRRPVHPVVRAAAGVPACHRGRSRPPGARGRHWVTLRTCPHGIDGREVSAFRRCRPGGGRAG